MHPHLFRHTLAQGVLDTTGNIKVAQEILGHSHLTTTTDLYMKVDQNAMVSALAQAKASSDRSKEQVPSSPATQYAFPYDDETISELERAIAQDTGVSPADGDSDVRKTSSALCPAGRIDLRGIHGDAVNKFGGTLCVGCRGKHCSIVSRKHFQPACDIGCMILARFKSQFQIGTQERSPEFGYQFFDCVTFAPEPMPPKSRSAGSCCPSSE